MGIEPWLPRLLSYTATISRIYVSNNKFKSSEYTYFNCGMVNCTLISCRRQTNKATLIKY